MEQDPINRLREGMETAFIDGSVVSDAAFKPAFISNVPSEHKKVSTTIEDELLKCESFQISVAFITRGGIMPLLMILKELEKKNIPGQILTTNYLDFSEPEALKKLHELKNIRLKMFDCARAHTGFHTKGYIFRDKEIYRIILGSSNMTGNALSINFEWNTRIVSTEQGEFAAQVVKEFDDLWNSEYSLEYEDFYDAYKKRYEIIKHQKKMSKEDEIPSFEKYTLRPNKMQEDFIESLDSLIQKGENKALLISATGTGKTYASAFAMRELGFKRVLFVVHREQLAKQALRTFRKVFSNKVTMGIVGGGKREYDCDYVFAMVETLSKTAHLKEFDKDEFDCIILDEAHHSPANTYQKIMNYFTPKLFLGMTATPDKRDDEKTGQNVYELFDHNIAHEIRLQKAMEDDLLCPFHYYGITDIATFKDEKSQKKELTLKQFNCLTDDTRVEYIIEQAEYYGHSGDRVKGLIFCGWNEECKELSKQFNKRGYRTVALSGADSQKERELAFERLAMDEEDKTDDMEPLDYIFSRDILNEGVDIVEINQVIMLRPTQSPIVFIQQLGRGLRKADNKDFVVILDFIGNYNNNFMIPVALSGDRRYNSDVIRQYVVSGNNAIAGSSSIHFDEVSKSYIFKSIDNIKSGTIKSIIKEGYVNLKNRLGRRPMLIDFYKNEEIDPMLIIKEYKSYYNLVSVIEKDDTIFKLNDKEKLTLEYLSKAILSGVRPCELEILRLLLTEDKITYSRIIESCKARYDYSMDKKKVASACKVLKGEFVFNSEELKRYSQIDLINTDLNSFVNRMSSYSTRLLHKDFYEQLNDIISVGLSRYKDIFSGSSEGSPFVLYEKYSRRDVSLLMDAGKDVSSTMYGMWDSGDDVFIFVTYHKREATEEGLEYVKGKPDYADEFVDNITFRWDSQIDKKLGGRYMNSVLKTKRKHLLVQKNDHENNFFYMGQFDLSVNDVVEAQKRNNSGILKPICKCKFKMKKPVREDILKYLQSEEIKEEEVV